MNERYRSHKDLRVFQLSYELAMEIFRISKSFPAVEKFSLTSQIRNSSRSVSANLTEAFRKRRYPKAFISKLSDAETEAAETQTWLEFARDCDYIPTEQCELFCKQYDNVIGMIVNMIHSPEKFVINK